MRRRDAIVGGAAALTLGGANYAWSTRDGGYGEAAQLARSLPRPTPGAEFIQLVRAATLAANSHNTQPWLFAGDARGVTIAPDLSRRTPVVDPDDHHLFVSLGCAAENLLIAAAANGRSGACRFDPASGGRLRIDLGGQAAANQQALFDAIARRQSTRAPYDGRAVSAPVLGQLAAAARLEGCQLLLLTARAEIERVLDLIVAANDAQVRDPAFVKELHRWIRFNGPQAVARGDGLFAACSGNPVLPGWLGDLLFPRVFTPEAENAKCVEQIRSSAGLAIFVGDRPDPGHWALVGRSFERFALQATALGLKLAFLNQPVELAAFRPRLAAALGLGEQRADLIVRFGHGPAMPYSLRRPPGAVIRTAV